MSDNRKHYVTCLLAYLTGWFVAQNVWNRWWKNAVTGDEVDRLNRESARETADEVLRRMPRTSEYEAGMMALARLLQDDNLGIKHESLTGGDSGHKVEIIFSGRRFQGWGITPQGALAKAARDAHGVMILHEDDGMRTEKRR